MHRLRHYLRYLLRATNRHGVHSPFVYAFVTQVLPHRASAAGAAIEALRKRCARDPRMLTIEDHGAGYGGRAVPEIQKSIREVVRSSARGRREGELLLRLCQHYQPQQVLELGTNLGFSGLYLASSLSPSQQLITIEGAQELSKVAAGHFRELGYRADLRVGEFEQVLTGQIDWESFRPSLVLLDGNHREAATLGYFEFLLPRVAPAAILVLDDIYWSPEMTGAWEQIRRHPRVTVSIDLYHLGIVFLDRPQAKEHFSLRFRAW